MKKSFFMVLFVVMLLVLCSCSLQEPEMLADPQNIQAANRVITWDPVENATGYLVSFDGEEYQIEETSFSYHFITLADTYRFSVIALGDGKNYSNSAIASKEITIEPPVERGSDKYGFKYTYINDIGGYEIDAGTADLSGMVVLPDYFGDWPVKRIAGRMFKAKGAYATYQAEPNCFTEAYCNKTTTGIQLPAYLESIGMDAFAFILNLEEIEIPDTVVEIGSEAFEGCKRLKKVVLPSNLKEIPRSCFENTALSEIILPEGLERIGGSAFATPETKYSTGGLFGGSAYGHIDSEVSEIVIPASVKEIASKAFYGRRNMKTVVIKGDLQDFSSGTFHDTAWLASQPEGLVYLNDALYCYHGQMPENTRIEIPAGTKSICHHAFNGEANLYEVVIPEGIAFWGIQIFASCTSLTKVTLPSDVKVIADAMFSDCTSLKNITIPETVTRIEKGAFAYTGLESLIIPASVKYVGAYAFAYCESLKNVSFSAGVEILNDYVFECCSALETVLIPATVKEIYCHPFSYCDALTHVFFEGGSFLEFEEKLRDTADEFLAELKAAPIYYYSEEKPTEEGNFWHYVDGKPTPWESEE